MVARLIADVKGRGVRASVLSLAMLRAMALSVGLSAWWEPPEHGSCDVPDLRSAAWMAPHVSSGRRQEA